jgi:hypothetical protein
MYQNATTLTFQSTGQVACDVTPPLVLVRNKTSVEPTILYEVIGQPIGRFDYVAMIITPIDFPSGACKGNNGAQGSPGTCFPP